MNATASRYNGHIVVRLSAAAAAPEAAETHPTHIGLLIDTSGSMTGTRINSVKRTLEAARPLFRETDTVSLVTFDDVGTTHLARHCLNNEGIEQFYQVVNNLRPNGATNLSGGLEKLYEISSGVGTDYTTLLLLTDGHINKGVTSVAGLKAMALGACRSAINTLGYGPDHSRSLLSQLAIASRGSYTYADTDEVLPVIVGDILAGVRGEVFCQVEVTVTGAVAVACQEAGSAGAARYTVGNMVADRDYWVVFRLTEGDSDLSTIQVSAAGGFTQTVSVTDLGERSGDPAGDPAGERSGDPASELAVQEQIYRCRVASELFSMSELLESRTADIVRINSARNSLTSLRTEIATLSGRPLLLRMMGQIAEAIEALEGLTSAATTGMGYMPAGNHLAARMSSGVTCLATQRGYFAGGGTDGAGDPANTCIFSSPSQRTGSHTVYNTYTHALDPVIATAAAAATLSPIIEQASAPLG
jgi:hypothetical protein